MKNCACAPTAPRGAVGAQAETRVWHRTAGHRRASLQEPCDDLYAHYQVDVVLAFPRFPRGPAGGPTETRGWSTFAGHRRASLQEPCDDLYARLKHKNYFGACAE